MASSHVEASQPVAPATLQTFSPGYQPSLSRISAIDTLKGIAVVAALFVTILYWGGFTQGMQFNLTEFPGGVRYKTYSLLSLLLEGKMMGLISLSFGAGIILFFVRPHIGSGLSNSDIYVRRCMWLILFGLVNAFIILWPQDILFHLGVMGLLLFPFPRMKTKWLLVSALVLLAINSGKYFWNYNDDTTAYAKFVVADSLQKKIHVQDSILKRNDSIAGLKKDSAAVSALTAKKDSTRKSADTLTHKQKKQIGEWEGIVKKYSWDKKMDSTMVTALQDTKYLKNWETQVLRARQKEAKWFYTIGVWELASIMLLGMWLFKTGFFFGHFSGQRYLAIAAAGITIGILLGWYRLHFWNLSIHDYTKYVQLQVLPHTIVKPFEIAFTTVGYASLVMFLFSRNLLTGLLSLFADIGKMALSNYLLQAVLLSVFFHGFGMGYYARLGQPGLYLLVIEMFIIQLLFTVFWTKKYYLGPAEWLLKSLIHRKKVPIKRLPGESTVAAKSLQTTSMTNHD